MTNTMRIGIVGTGDIAHMLAGAMSMTDGVCVAGVSSRNREKGLAFAARYDIPIICTSATELAQSDEIDLIYVATPHPTHYEMCMQALRAGKPVLCEKPLTTRLADTEALFAEAGARGLFLMEAMWTRFLPTVIRAREWIDAGRIGKVMFVDAEWSFAIDPVAPKQRLVDPAHGGGALFDIGCYGIEMASYYAGGNPQAWTGLCTPLVPGVDAMTALTLRYANGTLATVRVGLTGDTPVTLTIYGDSGRIVLPRYYMANEALLYNGDTLVDRATETFEQMQGYCWEIAAVRDYLREGITESPVVPAEDTIATARVMSDMMHRFFLEYY